MLSGVLVVACLVLGAIAWWRSSSRHGPAQETTAEMSERAATVFAKLSMQTPPPANDKEGWNKLLALAPVEVQKSSRPSPDLEGLRAEAREVLRLRFGTHDPDEYIQWRQSRGYKLKPLEELDRLWDVSVQYQEMSGSPLSKGTPLPEVFRFFHKNLLEYRGLTNRLTAVPAEAGGVGIVTGTMTPADPRRNALYSGTLGPEVWYGQISATHRSIWTPPRRSVEMLAAGENVPFADVGIVLEFADGSRRPIWMTFIRDGSQWYIEHLNVNNIDSRTYPGMDY